MFRPVFNPAMIAEDAVGTTERMELKEHSLRRAILEDMAAVAAIHRLAFFRAMPHMPDLHTAEEDLEFYTGTVFRRCEIWLSEAEGGGVAGFIAFRSGWVDHLYVHPDHQGEGRGSALLEVARNAASELRLWAFQCNAPARRFYERHGFRVEKETDGSDNEQRRPDVLYLWRSALREPRPSC